MGFYLTARENSEGITQGKQYHIIGIINDFFIVWDDKGERAIKHVSLFDYKN